MARKFVYTKEYGMIYRGPGFFAVVWFVSTLKVLPPRTRKPCKKYIIFFFRFLLFTLLFAILLSRSKYLFLWQEQLRLLLEGRPYEELHEFCDFRCVKCGVEISVCTILRIIGSWHLLVYQIHNFLVWIRIRIQIRLFFLLRVHTVVFEKSCGQKGYGFKLLCYL